MWAQLIKARIKPGSETAARQVEEELRTEHPSGGPIRSMSFRNEKDQNEVYNLVFFESEEKAREFERSPEQQQRVRRFWDLFEGQPEFVDLIPDHEWSV